MSTPTFPAVTSREAGEFTTILDRAANSVSLADITLSRNAPGSPLEATATYRADQAGEKRTLNLSLASVPDYDDAHDPHDYREEVSGVGGTDGSDELYDADYDDEAQLHSPDAYEALLDVLRGAEALAAKYGDEILHELQHLSDQRQTSAPTATHISTLHRLRAYEINRQHGPASPWLANISINLAPDRRSIIARGEIRDRHKRSPRLLKITWVPAATGPGALTETLDNAPWSHTEAPRHELETVNALGAIMIAACGAWRIEDESPWPAVQQTLNLKGDGRDRRNKRSTFLSRFTG